MGATPCTDNITIEFGCQFRVKLRDSSLEAILKAFCKLLPQILTDFIQKVLLGFSEKAMVQSWGEPVISPLVRAMGTADKHVLSHEGKIEYRSKKTDRPGESR